MNHLLRKLTLCAAGAILLLALSGNLMAQSPPACPSTGTRTFTWTSGNVTITATKPLDGSICNPSLTGCCQTFTISGLPLGWTLTGILTPPGTPAGIQSKFLFTTECLPPKIIQTYDVNFTSTVGNGGTFTQQICYPPEADWQSFEIHVDIAILVKDDQGNVASFVGNDPNVPGTIGPGGLPWDPVCQLLGCTPGFFKNHCTLTTGPFACPQSLVWPGGYLPLQTFDSAFGVSSSCVDSSVTLIQALNTGGGGLNGVLRMCTAALLSSAAAATVNGKGGLCTVVTAPSVAAVMAEVQGVCSGAIKAGDALTYCAGIANQVCPFNAWINTTDGTCNGTPCELPLQ